MQVGMSLPHKRGSVGGLLKQKAGYGALLALEVRRERHRTPSPVTIRPAALPSPSSQAKGGAPSGAPDVPVQIWEGLLRSVERGRVATVYSEKVPRG